MITYGIRIDGTFVPVANKHKGLYIVLNPLVLLMPNDIEVENDMDINDSIKTVKDLDVALSKQFLDQKPLNVIREDVLTNEYDKLCH